MTNVGAAFGDFLQVAARIFVVFEVHDFHFIRPFRMLETVVDIVYGYDAFRSFNQQNFERKGPRARSRER